MAGRMDARAPDTRYTGNSASAENPREAHQIYLRGPAADATKFCASVRAFADASQLKTALPERVVCTVSDHANGQASAKVTVDKGLFYAGMDSSMESPERDTLVKLAEKAGATTFIHSHLEKGNEQHWVDGYDRHPKTGTAVFGRPSS